MTREEIIARLKSFEMGWEKPGSAFPEFWRAVIDELEQEQDMTIAYLMGKYEDKDPCKDAISREDALGQLFEWVIVGEYEYTNAPEYLRKRLKTLPSVTPKPTEREDAISREDALKVASDECQELRGIYGRIEERIKTLPSVTPSRRKGHWIVDGSHYVCSECNHVHHWNRFDVVNGCKLGNFCPNCGAEME